jgi:hypothetical protein
LPAAAGSAGSATYNSTDGAYYGAGGNAGLVILSYAAKTCGM